MAPVRLFRFVYAGSKKAALFCPIFLTAAALLLLACNQPVKEPAHKKMDYIRKIEGKSDSIPVALAQRGETLIAYSDCHDCHTKTKRAKGPSFQDIAEKYPANSVFVEMLANRIILGGYGTWGKPVMAPHPHLSREDAKMMVMYILSLKKR
ncbi:c-type cytochrome [Terrimonas pollutisoli]|uniref:c-type cytochrome n=1 Tax=Terrimonas pollutisoli TaxID=3034147 RepID=UPI0023EB9208|nr:c-type cytochrome [Terrimonas sp. H1YJ31]